MSVFLAATSNSFLFATNVLEQSDPSIGPNCYPILHRQTIVSVRIVAKRKQNEKQIRTHRHDNHKMENHRLPDDISFRPHTGTRPNEWQSR
jgi:hypothetical protein